MSKKKNFLQNLLSYITYKDKKPVKEFFIPESDENDSKQQKDKTQENRKDNKSTNDTDKSKGIKKPVPLAEQNKEKSAGQKQADDKAIATDIQQNINYTNKKFNAPTNKDIIIREFSITDKHKAFIAYLDGMVDKTIINNFILRPLLKDLKFDGEDETCRLDFILLRVLETNQAKKVYKPGEAIYEILTGNTLLYVDGCDYYVTNETKGFPARGVEKPQIEGVVTGAQEAFNETLRTNVSLIRKLIKNCDLTTEFVKIGDVNQNLCALVYLKGIANPAVVDEVKRRISNLKVDYIAGDGMLEQFIEDNPHSIVPTILTTERPDKTAAHIVEGRVAILAEGVPFSKIVPVTAYSLIHSPEDSFMRWPYGTLLRFIRIVAMVVATLLPGLYVAMTNFHQEMIPTELLLAIAKAKEQVPFPTIVEVLLMEVSFELIREAGIRIPGIIGNTLGIIGALILGQAAVQANIVSPILIIVVAVTGLGNFALPNYNLALAARLIRFGFILLGALVGFYGITIGIALLCILLFDMKSFGVPFFAPIVPRTGRSSDLLIRYPIWKNEDRPDYVNAAKAERQPKVSKKWKEQDPKYGYDREDSDD